MCEGDKAFFPCDVFKFNLLEFSYTYILGLRTYVAKEPLDNYDEAKRRFLMLRVIYFVAMIFYYSFVGCIVYLCLHITGFTSYFNIVYDNLFPLIISCFRSICSYAVTDKH